MAKIEAVENGINVTPEARKLARQSKTMAARYEDITITSNGQYVQVAEDLKKVKGKLKQLLDLRLSLTRPLDQSKAGIMNFFRPPTEMLQRAERVGKDALDIWRRKQKAIAMERERKLAAQARAEEDRKRKILEEQARKQEAKAEELRKQAEEADERERQILEEKASLAEEKAEEKRERREEVHVPAPIIANPVPKVKGIHETSTWKYRVKNIKIVPREFMMLNDSMVGDFARNTKGKIPIAGIEFYEQTGTASGVK